MQNVGAEHEFSATTRQRVLGVVLAVIAVPAGLSAIVNGEHMKESAAHEPAIKFVGPTVISTELDIIGDAELLIGGELTLVAGAAALAAVRRREECASLE